MKIIIFGGGGYVGLELCKLLSRNSHDITIADNFSNGDAAARKKAFDLGVSIAEVNIADTDEVNTVMQAFKPDIVYNLAAIHYIPYCITHPTEVFQANISGTQNIITSIKSLDHIKPRLIFSSSASVYGSLDRPCREDDPYNPNDIYGASKVAGELLIRHQLDDYTILRFFNIIGGKDPHPHLTPKVIENVISNKPLRLGTRYARRDFVDVRDVADALYLAKDAPSNRIFNVGTGSTYSVEELVETVKEVINNHDFDVRYETPSNMRENDAPYLCADIEEAKRTLRWFPRHSFEDSIVSSIKSYTTPIA